MIYILDFLLFVDRMFPPFWRNTINKTAQVNVIPKQNFVNCFVGALQTCFDSFNDYRVALWNEININSQKMMLEYGINNYFNQTGTIYFDNLPSPSSMFVKRDNKVNGYAYTSNDSVFLSQNYRYCFLDSFKANFQVNVPSSANISESQIRNYIDKRVFKGLKYRVVFY